MPANGCWSYIDNVRYYLPTGEFGIGWLDIKGLMNREVREQLKEDLRLTRPAMQSWKHRFKTEAVHGVRFSTRAEAKSQVFEYIEVYDNRKRLHSTLGYVSPEAFEAQKVV